MKEVTRMNYGEKVLSRVLDPGVLLILVGAVVTYTSSLITRRVQDENRREKIGIAIKAVGCAVALVGAVMLFT